MDLYGSFFRTLMFPAWERVVRQRLTVDYLRDLETTQWYSHDRLVDLQSRKLRDLIRHAHAHVPFYRDRLRESGVGPDDIKTVEDLRKLPLLTRDDTVGSQETRQSTAAPFATVKKTTSGSSGSPLSFGYNIESDHMRNAVKLRGYGWAGYRIGSPVLFYWGSAEKPSKPSLVTRTKIDLDRRLKREHYIDCTPSGDDHLASVVAEIRRLQPHCIVAYSQAGASLARYVNRSGSRDWPTIPVLCAAERVLDADRDAIRQAFGPAVFETYGSREFMLHASECEAHDGMHVSMENLIIELVVRGDDGSVRQAEPGEAGELAITDLNNLGMPFIRYLNGDLAKARTPDPCPCGRGLARIGPVEGRVTATLRDGDGNPVNGLVFNLIFCELAESTRQFQAVQHVDGSITLKVVPAATMNEATLDHLKRHTSKYLPGVEIRTELVDDIPTTRTGKRRVVIVEKPA